MTTTDKLGYSHRPEIELPLDMGDGPFLSAVPAVDALAVQPAAVASVFRREQPFRETFLTDMPVIGKANMISMGYFRVSDKLRPNSFRRVFQSFRNGARKPRLWRWCQSGPNCGQRSSAPGTLRPLSCRTRRESQMLRSVSATCLGGPRMRLAWSRACMGFETPGPSSAAFDRPGAAEP